MRKIICFCLFFITVAASAAIQWEPGEFAGMIDDGGKMDDEVVTNHKLNGTNSITIIKSNITKGFGHHQKPFTNIWIDIERDANGDGKDEHFRYSLQNAIEQMNGNSITVSFDGFQFQEGDEIEIGVMTKDWEDGKLEIEEFDWTAESPADGNPVDNYFQSHLIDSDLKRFDGEFQWTFGEGGAGGIVIGPDGTIVEPPKPDGPELSGQPLPGPLMTILLGTTLLATVKRRQLARKA